MKKHTLRFSDTSIAVRETGSPHGQPVILIHGGPGLGGYLQTLTEHIPSSYRVIDYDQRGTRLSPSSGPFKIQDHMQDLRGLIVELCGDQKPILIGHSWGAILGISYCAEYIDDAQGLVLLNCAPLDPQTSKTFSDNINARLSEAVLQRTEVLIQKLEDDGIPETEREQLDHEYIQLITPVYQVDHSSVQRLPLEVRNLRASYETSDDYAACRTNGKLLELLTKIQTPVTAIHGAMDVIPYEGVFSHFTETRLIEQAGHFPWVEKNAQTHFTPVLKAVLDLIKN